MYMRTGCFLSAAVFCLLVSGMKWDGGEAARAAVIKVTPANVQASIDKLPESTPDSAKPRSLQTIMADSATYAGDDDDEDVIEFAPGTYDDVGELLVTRPLTLRKDPGADGDAVITGELLIQIRSRDVKVEDLTFRDLEVGKVTILREGEVARNRGHRWELSGPVEVYFEDVTTRSFLLDRKAKVSAWQAENGCSSDRASCPSCPSDGSMPDCAHDYSSYTGQLHRTELGKHIAGISDRLEYFPLELASSRQEGKEGWPISRSGGVTNWNRGDRSLEWIPKWNIAALESHWAKSNLGHILINSRWYPSGNDDACPASEAFTGIEIARNSFDGTEMGAVYMVTPDIRNQSGLFPQRSIRDSSDREQPSTTTDCAVEANIVGNTFRNIGVTDSAYLPARNEDGSTRTDSAGKPVFLMDGEGNRIPRNNADEYAIELGHSIRKATISDNTIEKTSYGSIRIQDILEDGEITISNNLFRISTEGGSRNVDSPIGILGGNDDVEVMIRGNRIIYSDSNVPYLTTYYYDFLRRAKWCGVSDRIHVTNNTTIKQLDAATEPAIWQSYMPNFPYPPIGTFVDANDIDGDRDKTETMTGVVDADEGDTEGPAAPTPVRLINLARSSATVGDFNFSVAGDGILKSNDIMVGRYDIVRYKSCLLTAMILIHQNGVSVVDNDLGYGGDGSVNFAIQMPSGVSLAKFSGNNVENYASSLVGGGFSGGFATSGNYIGTRPRVSRSVTLDRTGELSEPVAREQGAIGPRAGMNADDPPVVPRIASASVSPTARNVVVVTYDADLASGSEPPDSAFTVQYQSEEGRIEVIRASGVSVSGRTVTLTLAKEIPSGASGVTVVYTAPGGDAAIRGALGNLEARDQSRPVTTGDGGPGPGELPPPSDQPGGDGGGGCVLASSESGGVDLGTLLFLTFLGLAYLLDKMVKIRRRLNFMSIERVFGLAVLLAVFCAGYGAGGDARAQETINIFPANADDAAITKVKAGATASDDDNVSCGSTGARQSLMACTVQELVNMADSGDTVIFNPAESGENRNVYDDVGEVLVATDGDDSSTDGSVETITIRGKGSGDDMITFTGKILFNVKAGNIVIRGFKFKDTEIPDAVTMRVAGDGGTPAAVRYGFPGMTIRDYLVAEGAGSPAWTSSDVFSPQNIANKGGFLWDNFAARAVRASWLNYPFVVTVDASGKPTKAIAKLNDGTEVGTDGSDNKQISGWSFTPAITAASALNTMGTIWVDSVVTTCTGGISVKNVQIRNNIFDNTYLAGVKAGDHSSASRYYIRGDYGAGRIRGVECGAQVEVIGNEFTNVGGNGPFLKNSRGVDFTDAGGNKIAGFGNREAAISFFNAGSTGTGDEVVSSKITDNTIVGGTYSAITVVGTRPSAKVDIMFNDIKNSPINGIDIVSRTDDGSSAFTAATADITIEGNRIWGSSSNRFLNKPFQSTLDDGRGRVVEGANVGKSGIPFLIGEGRNFNSDVIRSCFDATTNPEQGRIVRAMSPEVWKSAVPDFPFPDSGAPKSILTDNLNPNTRDEAHRFRIIDSTTITVNSIAGHDLIRYRADECFDLGRIRIDGQRGVTIRNNDLGYVEDESDTSVSLMASPDNGVVVKRANSPAGVPLKAFTGNNITFYRDYAVLNKGAVFSAKDNYLGVPNGYRFSNVNEVNNNGGVPFEESDQRMIGPREQFAMMPDEEPPALVTSGDGTPAVNESGTTLTLTFNDMLDATSTPAASPSSPSTAFQVWAGTSTMLSVTGVRISGSTVVLTLGSAARQGETITVTYTKPDSNPIKDDAGLELDSFSRAAVTNGSTVTADPDDPDDPDDSRPAAASTDGGCALASAGSGVDLGALVLLLGSLSFAFGLGRKAKAE